MKALETPSWLQVALLALSIWWGPALAGLQPALAAADDIYYACDLSADEESHEVYSPGTGHAAFVLERETLKLSWNVTYEGLTGPATSAGLYGPDRPGGNAGFQVDLAPKGLKSPLIGAKVLNDGELQYLVTGRMYVNIVTSKYKDGELRCQVTRLRGKPAPKPALTQ
jgi:hypothetical protein